MNRWILVIAAGLGCAPAPDECGDCDAGGGFAFDPTTAPDTSTPGAGAPDASPTSDVALTDLSDPLAPDVLDDLRQPPADLESPELVEAPDVSPGDAPGPPDVPSGDLPIAEDLTELPSDTPELEDKGEAPCGDGVLSVGEDCDPGIASGPGSCPSVCADPPGCTALVLEGEATLCTAQCVTTFVTALADGDGCCPPAGTAATDSDCDLCGDGVLQPGEACDDSVPQATCPTACALPVGCEIQALVGTAGECTAECATSMVSALVNGDGCCPAGATHATDDDCEPEVCGDGKLGPGEECDGALLGGATCANKWGYPSGPAQCLPDCTLSSLLCPGSHLLLYEPTGNLAIVDDIRRVRWHPTGDMAALLGAGGRIGRYDAATKQSALVTTVTGTVEDLDAHPDGTHFLVVGSTTDGKSPKVWRLDVALDTLTFDVTEVPNTLTGRPSVVVHSQDPAAMAFIIGTYASSGAYQNRLFRWDADAVLDSKAYVGSAGLAGLAYVPKSGSPYPGSAAVITSEGVNGTGSQSWVLSSNLVVGNAWPGSNGNSGRGAWRPGGSYGVFAATSSSAVYVFDGAWDKSFLVGLSSAATAIAVDWRPDGSRALVVARPILGAAKVFDHRPSGPAYNGSWLDVSLPGFDSPPYNASSSTTLWDVDWRPGSLCDEGLIAASDNGSQFSPSFGILLRFYDQDDPDCP